MDWAKDFRNLKIASVENGHIEYAELEKADYDFIGRVLTLHLMIEHHMDVMLQVNAPYMRWNDIQLRFEQKYQLLEFSNFSNPQINVGSLIKNINRLRNKMAHRLGYKADAAALAPLYEAIDSLGAPEAMASELKSDPAKAIGFLGEFVLAGLNGAIHATSRIARAGANPERAAEEAEKLKAEALKLVSPDKHDALQANFLGAGNE